MAARKLLNTEDAQTLRLLEAYGVLIANTDRHYGNISLLIKTSDKIDALNSLSNHLFQSR
jgi:hypothetical protein